MSGRSVAQRRASVERVDEFNRAYQLAPKRVFRAVAGPVPRGYREVVVVEPRKGGAR